MADAYIRYGIEPDTLEIVMAEKWLAIKGDVHVPQLESVTDAFIIHILDPPAPNAKPWEHFSGIIERAYFGENTLSSLLENEAYTDRIPVGAVYAAKNNLRASATRGFRPLQPNFTEQIVDAYNKAE